MLIPDPTRGYTHDVRIALIPAREAVTGIVPTLRQMETDLSISEPARDPDLGKTHAVIGMREW